MKKYLLSLYLFLHTAFAIAAPTPIKFDIIPDQSHIKFQAMQGKSAINGEFKNFVAEIDFHPESLATSHVKVTIDIASITVGDSEAESNLKSKDWFDTASFPQAVFESKSFKSLGDKRYEANGNITIKGHTEPITLTFTLNEFSSASAYITGTAVLKHKAFGMGEPNNNSVRDEVSVAVDVKATAVK
jgi:polyisoprenoid-binding protein YceI